MLVYAVQSVAGVSLSTPPSATASWPLSFRNAPRCLPLLHTHPRCCCHRYPPATLFLLSATSAFSALLRCGGRRASRACRVRRSNRRALARSSHHRWSTVGTVGRRQSYLGGRCASSERRSWAWANTRIDKQRALRAGARVYRSARLMHESRACAGVASLWCLRIYI